MSSDPDPNKPLSDHWIDRLKSVRLIAVLVVLTAVAGGATVWFNLYSTVSDSLHQSREPTIQVAPAQQPQIIPNITVQATIVASAPAFSEKPRSTQHEDADFSFALIEDRVPVILIAKRKPEMIVSNLNVEAFATVNLEATSERCHPKNVLSTFIKLSKVISMPPKDSMDGLRMLSASSVFSEPEELARDLAHSLKLPDGCIDMRDPTIWVKLRFHNAVGTPIERFYMLRSPDHRASADSRELNAFPVDQVHFADASSIKPEVVFGQHSGLIQHIGPDRNSHSSR